MFFKSSLFIFPSSFRHGDKTIPELLMALVSRDKPLPVAMGAARCLTFIHRAGALGADDNRYYLGFQTSLSFVRLLPSPSH